jgi:RNA polymerase sigma-70 factor, ECF subfamily
MKLKHTEQMNNIDEGPLLDRARNGDHEAFCQLFRSCEKVAYGAARKFFSNLADVEDVVQEGAMKAFMAVKKFRGESKFSTWLAHIVINVARMKLRKERPHLFKSLDSHSGSVDGTTSPRDFADLRESAADAVERQELRQVLHKAISSLGPNYRRILVLRDLEDCDTRMTAAALGLTEQAVKSRLGRARQRLREVVDAQLTWNNGPLAA